MSDENEEETQPQEADTRPTRQVDCDPLLAALGAHGLSVDMGHLTIIELPQALADLLVESSGPFTRAEIDDRLWARIHDELARKLVAVEEEALNAPPPPSPFLVRASEQELRNLERAKGHRLH